MTATLSPPRVGVLPRDWRHRRRRSQLDLAVAAGVSARHLSFVETGRSQPSRQLVLHLAAHLEVPLRDRNLPLLAAGFAPAYRQTALQAEEMAPVRDAVAAIGAGHEPNPAVVVDRHWTVVASCSCRPRTRCGWRCTLTAWRAASRTSPSGQGT